MQQIALVDRSGTPLGHTLAEYAEALNHYITDCIVPAWGTACAANLYPALHFRKYTWAVLFCKLSDVKDALAYHEVTDYGTPLSLVFVDTILEAGQDIGTAVSHELVEMLVDPDATKTASGPGNDLYALEAADPCEESSFLINDIQMSDFVYPSYFQQFQHGVRFDYLRQITQPFELLPGGYQSVLHDGQWTEVFGSKEKEARYAKVNHGGHRSERRRWRK